MATIAEFNPPCPRKPWIEICTESKKLLFSFEQNFGQPVLKSHLSGAISMETEIQRPKLRRGFASMSVEKRKQIAAMGGASVRPEQRSFSQNRDLAVAAGRKGGSASTRGPAGPKLS
jgi:hypothetical protein